MSKVGIIANPASGKDIRRLVAYGSVFDNQEKVHILRRVLIGLQAAGVEKVLFMPDTFGMGARAIDGVKLTLEATTLQMPFRGTDEDSTEAAARFRDAGGLYYYSWRVWDESSGCKRMRKNSSLAYLYRYQ